MNGHAREGRNIAGLTRALGRLFPVGRGGVNRVEVEAALGGVSFNLGRKSGGVAALAAAEAALASPEPTWVIVTGRVGRDPLAPDPVAALTSAGATLVSREIQEQGRLQAALLGEAAASAQPPAGGARSGSGAGAGPFGQ